MNIPPTVQIIAALQSSEDSAHLFPIQHPEGQFSIFYLQVVSDEKYLQVNLSLHLSKLLQHLVPHESGLQYYDTVT